MNAKQSHTNLKEDARLTLALRKLLATPDGRYVFRRLLEAYGIRQSAFAQNALLTAHALGMQNAGLLLEDLLSTAAFELFLQMLKEHNDEQTAR